MEVAETVQEKVNIISLLPSTWSKGKIQRKFGVTDYLVRKTKDLVKEQGVLPKIGRKQSNRSLDASVIEVIQDFYASDDHSRIMPGRKDCISVIKDGKKAKTQKRLILCNLKELYRAFKERYPHLKVGFSKFTEHRPKFCVLAGAHGTHCVCVCLYHQNLKLMLSAINYNNSCEDVLKHMVCDVENENCMIFGCKECPGVERAIASISSDLQEDEEETQVLFKQWVSVDRCELTTCLLHFQDFIEKLREKLLSLKFHHFVAKKQAQFLKDRKESLEIGEFVVLGDFSGNFSFIFQDEIQTFHWSNIQVTLHPFIIYWRTDGELKTQSFCFLSDSLKHTTTTFYVFQRTLIEFLKVHHVISKIIYFSDGSAAQYKNRKNFMDLCLHEKDFAIKAEWHFFATSHGKGPCDGIGGAVKRLVRKASLQRPVKNQICTPTEMFQYCCENIQGVNFFYCSADEIKEAEEVLKHRYQTAKSIPKTRTFHSFIPSDGSILAKKTSSSTKFMTFQLVKSGH